MTLVIDAPPLVALADEREPRRDEILEILRADRGSLFIPAAVTAESDYLLDRRFGPPARRAFLEDLAARRYESPALEVADYEAAARPIRGQLRDPPLSVVGPEWPPVCADVPAREPA